ncbi:MAG: aldose 1-epimerase family protein [Gaiellaceae bacterium]
MPELYGRSFPKTDLLRRVGRLDQVAGVRLVTLGDGAERGVRVLEFRTGSGFAFEVIVDRAFDIGRCELGGTPLAWTSAVGFAGPWFYEWEDLGFFRNWGGGLLTTCGLDHALFMADDTASQYHYPPKQTERFGLHGRASNRPARLIGYGERWDGEECVLFAEGEVLQASVFGEQLLLRRRIEATVGGSRLTIHDEVENVGFDTTPHMLLYHVNAGFPVVDEGSEVFVPARSVEARGDHSTDGYRRLEAPTPAFVEQVFEHDIVADADGIVPVAVANRDLGLGVYEVFRRDQLPFHFMWRTLGEGTYAVGIEPCTNRVAGRLDARERGELIELAAGESRTYDLELGALDGAVEIDAFADRVAALVS